MKDAVVPRPTATSPTPRHGLHWRAGVIALAGLPLVALVIALIISTKDVRSPGASPSVPPPAVAPELLVNAAESRDKMLAEKAEQLRLAQERQQLERKRRIDEVGRRAVECVRSDLVSPASAQFSDVFIEYIESNDVYTVSGTVDSQNVYGAMLRSQFRRFMRYTDSGCLDITDSLNFDQKMALMKAANAQLEASNARVKQLLDSIQHDK